MLLFMTPLLQSIIAVGAISLVSLVGLGALSLRQDLLKRGVFLLIALAAGALLGDAFLHLIPDAFSEADPLLVSLLILAGILTFFVLEKFLHWHHSHGEEEFSPDHSHIHPVGTLVIASDALHNLVDGLAIGVAFMISTEVGIATTIAIALHELPQEVGDFGILIHAGYSRMKALFVNFLSALTAFLGLAIAFVLGTTFESAVPLIAAFAAGNFIYIAMADIVPELQKTTRLKKTLLQIATMLVGIAAMVGLLAMEGGEHSHANEEAHELAH